ncbi:MAG: ABC-F family ATP-binding cassette domain-containing protein [Schleiferiaceae bacterium]|nr:ABC-F family ATP-binding cassette domain-containing protein [Schleiferiaceae bacterium]
MDSKNLLSVHKISKSFGVKILYQDITFGIHEGEKIAIIAKNGAGKTTLMQTLIDPGNADSGDIVFRSGLKIRYLPQQPSFNDGLTVRQVLYQSDHEGFDALKIYEEVVSKESDPETMQAALDRVEITGGWTIESRIQEIHSRMNLPDMDRKVNQFSGGEIKRLALAQLFVEEPDLILMDEPTNHLDLDIIEWLEEYLINYKGALLMITHDRYFLERVCGTMFELENLQFYKYEGNYSYYLEQKELREANEAVSLHKAKQLFKKELDWIRKSPSARTGKSKDRIDRFKDIKKVANQIIDNKEVSLSLNSQRLGGKILELHKIAKSYPDKLLIENFSYIFKKGERAGIVGPNGCGKSTLLKLIMESDIPDMGKIITGETVIFGHYTQDGMIDKNDLKVIEVVQEIGEYITLKKGHKLTASQLCERFLFDKNQQYSYVSTLSGGERRRLFLLTILMKNPNFLILDEPTNDLDILTLQALEDFLEEFQGCLLIVSHDRYFLDKLCQHLFIFEGEGKIKDFNGSYYQWREEKKRLTSIKIKAPNSEKILKKKNLQVKTKLNYSEKREWNNLPSEISALEKKRDELNKVFESNNQDPDTIIQASKDIKIIITELDEKEMRWLELSELGDI